MYFLYFWHFISRTTYNWAYISLNLPLAIALPGQLSNLQNLGTSLFKIVEYDFELDKMMYDFVVSRYT